jgi:hypothetical protein
MDGEGLLEDPAGIVGGVGVEGWLDGFRGVMPRHFVVEVALIDFEQDFRLGERQLQLVQEMKVKYPEEWFHLLK